MTTLPLIAAHSQKTAKKSYLFLKKYRQRKTVIYRIWRKISVKKITMSGSILCGLSLQNGIRRFHKNHNEWNKNNFLSSHTQILSILIHFFWTLDIKSALKNLLPFTFLYFNFLLMAWLFFLVYINTDLRMPLCPQILEFSLQNCYYKILLCKQSFNKRKILYLQIVRKFCQRWLKQKISRLCKKCIKIPA